MTDVISCFLMTLLLIASTCSSPGEEIRKETRDGMSEPDGAVARVAPRGLRRRLRGLTRLLQLFAAVLRAFGNGLADAFSRLFDAFPDLAVRDLLRAAFDLIRRVLYLRVVGSDGESGCEQQRKREYKQDDQPESFHRGSSFCQGWIRPFTFVTSCILVDVDWPAHWILGHWSAALVRSRSS